MDFNPAADFKLLLAVPLIPLAGYLLQIFLGKRLPKGDWILTAGMGVSMLITLWMAAKAVTAGYAGEEFIHQSADVGMSVRWIYSGENAAPNMIAGLFYDNLGAAMLAVVGIVAFFVHLFSIGYMHGDRRYRIFFANISLFTFAMLGVVLSDNILFFFAFWEVMGLMSYLLIGHFSHDPTSPRITHAAAACKKAFLTTRVGDTLLLLGILIFYFHFGTFQFTELWAAAADEVAANGGEYPAWMFWAGLCVFGGTVGKSAQFPLHIWLPDAMEGPTPVSAMIHAATMVAAGVFLLGRMYPLMSPDVLMIVAAVGAFTALFAATIGMTVWDIKGVLAYSTISQLGFMVAAVGCGGVVAGMFHMVTHAFFKGCLFLSAGSVIHGCHHEQDMKWMGGLRRMMPWTFAAMLISTMAISGVPLFAGFFSKDMILLAAFQEYSAHQSGAALFAAIALPLAAMLTAFYMFRLIFLTFTGAYRGHDNPNAHGHDDHGHAPQPHESPRPMVVSLVALAALGFLGGNFWLAAPFGSGDWFNKSVSIERLYGHEVTASIPHLHVESEALHAEHVLAELEGMDASDPQRAELEAELGHFSSEVRAMAEHKLGAHHLALPVSLLVAGLGILGAVLLYLWKVASPEAITQRLGLLYTTVRDKYYVDEIVNATVIRFVMALSALLKLFDEKVVDGLVNLVGYVNKQLGFAAAWVDLRVVDGLVNALAMASQAFGAVARLLQTGRIQQYAAMAMGGALLAAAWLILN